MRILDISQMQAVDRFAIEELGVPGPVLMENAAIGVVDALGEAYSEAVEVMVVCGPGNNGGDGLAVARHLHTRGYGVRIFMVVEQDSLRGDARLQLEVCQRLGLPIFRAVEEEERAALLRSAEEHDVVVDAMFGTGLTRPLEGGLAQLVEGLSRSSTPILAVDLPSGLDAGRREIIGPAAVADLTVTFAALKVAHVLAPAADLVGRVVVTDLGVPPELVEEAAGERLHLLVGEELAPFLVPRAADSHKGTYGHLLVVAGSRGKSGAAVLACRGALRSGAGLVTAAVPDRLVEVVESATVESMTSRLASNDQGELLAASAAEILEACEGRTALAMGPGLGTHPETCDVVRRVAAAAPLPLVLDADGLNALAPAHGGSPALLAERAWPTILTPHPGELARLLGLETGSVLNDRIAAARRAAHEASAVVVLKGHQSLVVAPDGEVWINSTGNPGMASGGSGDVLTGVLGSLLGQGFEALAAAQLGVFLHGLAADLAVLEVGEASLVAGDLLSWLPAAFAELAESEIG